MSADGERKRCVTSGCGNAAWTRGLCNTCYQLARKRVMDGEVTWEAIEKAGCAVPKKKHPMAVALDAIVKPPKRKKVSA